jgi:D-3-phosphoglycerate dehydrogenase
MSKFKVVATSTTFGVVNKEPLAKLIEAGCEVVLNERGRPYTEEELIEIASDADAVIVGNDHITENVIKQLPNVKLYAKHGVGYDKIDVKAADEHGVYVTNVPGSNSNEVADLVFAFIGNLARHINIGNKEVREGIWNKRRGISMHKKTIGIIGTGHIGQLVIKRANGFDMNVLGYDMFESDEAKSLGLKYVSLDELLKESDFITLHLPSTPETKHIIDKEAFSKMKDNVLLINTAREDLVNLDDLNEALSNHEIGGFATDAYSTEPAEYKPYFDHENVLLTPHIGATTVDANLNMGLGAVESILAIKEGKKPRQEYIRNNVNFKTTESV